MPDPSARLRTRFAASARHHARKAVGAYQEASYADFYLHAGTALELAIKARLVGDHGVHCLAPDRNNWFQTMLLITRDVDGSMGDHPQTVSAKVALERLQQLDSDLPLVFSQNVRSTIHRRNIGAHVGHGGPPTDAELLSHAATFVRAVSSLLRSDPGEFWAEWKGLALSLVEDELSAVKVRVEAALAGGRSKRTQLTNEAFGAAGDASLRDLDDEGPDVIGARCPACGATGWAHGYVLDDGEAEAEYEDGGYNYCWCPDMQLVLKSFECRTCGLRLDNDEEVAAAGLPERMPNDRATPDDVAGPDDLDEY